MINILDSKIYNRIAAGEVIERPRSVVKELIENSIDAQAKNITLEIEDGGISLIRVTDDGCGLDAEDLKKAFLPHATSKIHSIKDLDAIITLGFRGEALASIASVAKAEMISRQKGAELGAKITYDNGEVVDYGEIGCAEGTTVSVEKLFENIPARKKFLDKPAAEEREITALVIKLILSNPEISFRYISDGDIIFISNGKGIKEAIYSVYGSEFFSNLEYIENEFPDISIKGYVGRPTFSKHNRSYQSLIVNGRYIVDSEISYMIQNYYSQYLMSRQFPVYILYLNLPPDMVDINVHPNKMEIKFADFKRVKQVISQSIKMILNQTSAQPIEIIMDQLFGSNQNENSQNLSSKETQSKSEESESHTNNNLSGFAFPKFDKTEVRDDSKIIFKESNFGDFIRLEPKSRENLTDGRLQSGIFNGKKQDRGYDIPQQKLFTDDSLKIIGKAFNTYIFIEKDNNLYLIDQHAAHERYLFDKLTLYYDKNKSSQQLLFPYVFEVSFSERDILNTALTELKNFGFEISEKSEFEFVISAIPTVLSEINLNEFTNSLLKELENEEKLKITTFMKETLASIACKAAIKGNYELSESEILSLIKDIGDLKVLQCPHGRPVIIQISKYEIEKWFKRKT